MCFALATSASSSAALRGKAEQAALCYAHRPAMRLDVPLAGDHLLHPISSYAFQSSYLFEGLARHLFSLLRPFWHKPAVVVTEGRPIRGGSAYALRLAARQGGAAAGRPDAGRAAPTAGAAAGPHEEEVCPGGEVDTRGRGCRRASSERRRDGRGRRGGRRRRPPRRRPHHARPTEPVARR